MQPPADGVQQCLFIGVLVSSQASPTSFSFPPSYGVKACLHSGCGNTVHPKFVMVVLVLILVFIANFMEEQHFRHFSCGMNSVKASSQNS